MADYGATAASIYDPQQASEASVLERGKANQQFGLDEEAKTIDPMYNDAIKSASTARNEEGARQDLLYSTALSGQGSGLQGNQQRILGEKLIETTGKLETERASKKSNIATRRAMVGDDYTAGMGALAAKYAGLKSAYVTDAQNRDADIAREAQQRKEDQAFQVQMANMSAAAQRSLAQMQINAANANKPTPAQIVADAFTGYQKESNKSKVGATESVVIPRIQAQLGLSLADAKKLAYDYRKANFGE